MNRKILRRYLFGAALLVAVGGGIVYRNYRHDMTLAYQRVTGGGTVVETACGPVEYTEFGAGPPMLMVHGAGGGYDQGAYLATLVGGSQNYRWIAPSRFGFAGMPAPEGADTPRQAQAHACLLDALGIDQVGVVGISMGGPSALAFAAQYPERTNSLAVISAVSHAMPARPGPLATLFSAFLNDFVFWSIVHTSPQGLLVALGVPMEIQEQLSSEETAELNHFLTLIMPMGARRQGQLLEQIMTEYDASILSSIQAPTLVLHAPDDTLVPIDQGEYTVEHVPGAVFVLMEKGGHLALMFDLNADAMGQLRAFLAQHNAR